MKDIIIIGGGPAGLTAAVYALRSGKSVLLFERKSYGGQISKSHCIENYPAVSSVSGAEFSMNLYNQAKSFGCEFRNENVTAVEKKDRIVVTTNKGEYESRAVIFAVGAEARASGLENEGQLIGRGLSYCALCDGNFFRNKEVMVVGGGSTALQDALYLAEICSKVYLVHRRDAFRGEKRLVEKLLAFDNVEVIFNSVLTAATAQPLVDKATVRNLITGEERQLQVRGIFLAIGQVPQTKDFGNILPLDKYGYVAAGEGCEIEKGVYVCGDCRQKPVRQLTTATADGTVAATLAGEYIDSLK